MRGHIRPRGPDKWQLVCETGLSPTGKRRQAFKTFCGSKRAAQRELANLIASINARTFLHPAKTTVAAFLERWLETYARARVTALTFEKYGEIVHKHLIPALGYVVLSRLQPEQIQQLYAQWMTMGRLDGKPGGLSPSTVAKFHAVLREALQTAVKWRLLAFNSAEHVDLPRRRPRTIVALTREQSARLLHALSENQNCGPLRIPILLMLFCGLRRSEVLALRWSAVDWNAKALRIDAALERTRCHGLTFKLPKNGKVRTLLLPSFVLEALSEHKHAQERLKDDVGRGYTDRDLIVANFDGKPRDPLWLSKAVRRLFLRLGLPNAGPHLLRHTFTTRAVENDINPKVLSEALGHSRVSITLDIYAHITIGAQQPLSNAVDEEIRTILAPPQLNSPKPET